MSSLLSSSSNHPNPQDPKHDISAPMGTVARSDSVRRSCDCKKYKAQERACPCSVTYTLNHVQKMLDQTLSDTSFFQPSLRAQQHNHVDMNHDEQTAAGSEPFQPIPQYTKDDFIIGSLIGKGGFCYVSEVDSISSEGWNHHPISSENESAATKSLNSSTSEHETTATTALQSQPTPPVTSTRYAIKHVRKDIMLNKKKFARATADLMIEAHFLAVVNYPNIIRLYGITAGASLFHIPDQQFLSNLGSILLSGSEQNIFLLLERVHTTLTKRIHEWQEKTSKLENRFGFIPRDWKGSQRQKYLFERLHVAYELAQAMLYLHRNNIVYRDLKPDNIGFDKNGTVKLFDFGLAKELRPNKMNPDGTYNLTGRTGSRRYMAPEVAMNKSYNSSADIFSYGMLLHELCSLDKPFDGFTEAQHMDLVVIGGKRPPISLHGSNRLWPECVRNLIERCWVDDLHKRPSFDEVVETLQLLGDDVVGPSS